MRYTKMHDSWPEFVPSSRISSPGYLLHASLLICTVFLLAVPIVARSAERLFDTSTSFASGSYPEGFYSYDGRVADLNADGNPDYVASNHWFPNKLSVVLHDGNGGYLPPTFLTIASSSVGVEVADFTRDGLLDILASNTGSNYQGSTVSFVRNLGGGTFAPAQSFAAVAGPADIVAADFDGDGWIDAAVAGYGDSNGQGTQVAILRNNGAGGFLAPALLTVGMAPSELAAGDLNGDDRPDLVVARDNFKLTVLMNSGGGAFAAPVEYTTQDHPWAGDVYANAEIGDIDRDGDLDVVCSSSRTQIDPDYGAICYFKNQGNGTLGNRSYISMPRYVGGPLDMALADFTGDGWLDFLSAHGDATGWALTPSLGGGAFGVSVEYAGGNDPMKVAPADADADGDLDALVLNRYSLTLGVHLNDGAGLFLEPDGRDLEPLCGWMDAGDIDGDGDLDVVSSYAYAGGGGLSVIKNNGDGSFAPRQNYTGPRGAMTPRFTDLDGDSDLDLVWAFDPTSPPYDFAVRLNNGSGSFGPATVWPVGTCGTGDLVTMDVDQDGDLDVLLTDWLGCAGGGEDDWVWIRRNNGDATFAPPYVLTYTISPHYMAVGDFNGDEKDDLATQHADGIKIVMALGNGQFGPAAAYNGPDAEYVLCAADLNGDGLADIATGNLRDSWEGTMSIFLNQGDGTLGSPTTVRCSFSTDVTAIGQIDAVDADLDGDRDLLLMSYGGQDLLVYENDGNGGFALQNRYVVGAAPGDYRCLDFTGDDRPDIGAVIGLPPANLNKRFVVAPGIQMNPAGVESPTASSALAALNALGPNPFSDFTRLTFALPARGAARLGIYDAAGRRVASLLDGVLGAGEHVVTWDGRDESDGQLISSGVYFARLVTAGGESHARLLVIR